MPRSGQCWAMCLKTYIGALPNLVDLYSHCGVRHDTLVVTGTEHGKAHYDVMFVNDLKWIWWCSSTVFPKVQLPTCWVILWVDVGTVNIHVLRNLRTIAAAYPSEFNPSPHLCTSRQSSSAHSSYSQASARSPTSWDWICRHRSCQGDWGIWEGSEMWFEHVETSYL